ncbi:Small heat shock protein, chloroplastic [Apostasia shenzhenica]|uniref:Small heat shock protein, chloroplastic n=1 Tax=Apostasia shenzhenica TaxID=1088818 RepID=A0A2I0BC02_9ASPA|nr:Small heat shock protein, chloroplastic [Apostasia shenzhenica]
MSHALSAHPISISAALPSLRRRAAPPIRCVAGNRSADNLDYLQRARKQQAAPPQQRPRRAPPLGLWDRFPAARTVQQMMDTMERVMEDPFFSEEAASAAGNAGAGLNGYRRGGRTPWEIREAEAEYRMRFDLPGMTKKDVKVWVEEGVLVIKAEKQQAVASAEGQEGGEEEEEWSFGRYSSRIALPEKAVVEKIKAEVRDGVLYVMVPKAEPSSKVLDINVQ